MAAAQVVVGFFLHYVAALADSFNPARQPGDFIESCLTGEAVRWVIRCRGLRAAATQHAGGTLAAGPPHQQLPTDQPPLAVRPRPGRGIRGGDRAHLGPRSWASRRMWLPVPALARDTSASALRQGTASHPAHMATTPTFARSTRFRPLSYEDGKLLRSRGR